MNENNELINKGSDEKEYLITEENYQRLRAVQQEVYITTEMSPKIRKLLNALITEENLEKLTKDLIERYS